MALDTQGELEHAIREELRKRELLRVETRRPRLFVGIGGNINRGLTLAYLSCCDAELNKAMLRRVLTGAIWIAQRAHERGLRPTRICPYCEERVPEDEEHLLWWCPVWASARKPQIPEVMRLAKALRLGPLSDWPACLVLCGIIPDKAVQMSGMGEDTRWRKQCLELGRVPAHRCRRPLQEVEDLIRETNKLVEAGAQWAEEDKHPWDIFAHWLHEMFLLVLRACKVVEDESGLMFPVQFRKEPRNTYPWYQLQLPQPRRRTMETPRLGYKHQCPRCFKCCCCLFVHCICGGVYLPKSYFGSSFRFCHVPCRVSRFFSVWYCPDLLPAILRWMSELQWLSMPPMEERCPRAHW